MKEYAAYKGEDLIAIGTVEEIAEELGKKIENIRWHTYPTAARRIEEKNLKNVFRMVRLEDDE